MADNIVLARNTEKAPVCPNHSQTVAFSHYNNLSTQLPIDPATGELVCDCVVKQAEQCFKNIEAIVKSIDHTMNDVVRITIFLTDMRNLSKVEDVYKSFFPTYVPALTVVGVKGLMKGAKVQVEALLSNGEGTIPNAPQAGDLIKLVNNTHNAPYSALSSQTVAFSHYNNISAQLPIDPESGRITASCVCGEAKQCFKNIKSILTGIDVPFDDIVKLTIFVTDLANAERVMEVFKTFFPDSGIARAVGYVPAVTIVPVNELPHNARVQVEAVVSHGDGTPPQAIEDRHGLIIEANNCEGAFKSDFATQSVAFSHYNNISGQLPVDPATGELVAGGIKEQADRCLLSIKNIVESVDHVLADVVRVNFYVTNLADMDAINEVYANYFPEGTPARRVVEVAELPQGALLQVEAIVGNAEGTPPVA